jgi:hypothetical protein
MNSFSLLSTVISPEHVTKVLQNKVADGAAIFDIYDSPRLIITRLKKTASSAHSVA